MKEAHRLIMAIAFVSLSASVLLTSTHALRITTLLFDFTNGLDENFFFNNPYGLFTLDDTSGELRLTKPEDTPDDFLKLARIFSNFCLRGDFDIRVDYRLNRPLTDGQQLEFQLHGALQFFNVRSNEEWIGGDNYHVFFAGHVQPVPTIATTDTSGTLRIVRKLDEVAAYFKSPETPGYTRFYSAVLNSGDVFLAMCLQNQPGRSAALDASFDNLSIRAQGVKHYLLEDLLGNLHTAIRALSAEDFKPTYQHGNAWKKMMTGLLREADEVMRAVDGGEYTSAIVRMRNIHWRLKMWLVDHSPVQHQLLTLADTIIRILRSLT